MKLIDSGVLLNADPGTSRANLTFGQVVALHSGTVLVTCRAGSTKDSADETIEICRSDDQGQSWSAPWRPFGEVRVEGKLGSLKLCYLTELRPGRLLAATMWVDRCSYPGQPLFNAQTEGCLPMEILLAESQDEGKTWSTWRKVPMPFEIGPASLTNPILKLADGSLAMSIENNKTYLDQSKWYQKVVFFHSHDEGATWSAPVTVGQDPTGRIFNWDMRCAVMPDGRVVTFAWTYDTNTNRYVNIHRRISCDHGHTWSAPEDLGICDQPGPPAVLADGQIVLPWVDRFDTHSIRVRTATNASAPFAPASEVVIYIHGGEAKRDDKTGELLAEMALWAFGLPSATALANGDVLVVYYAGSERALDIRFARLNQIA